MNKNTKVNRGPLKEKRSKEKQKKAIIALVFAMLIFFAGVGIFIGFGFAVLDIIQSAQAEVHDELVNPDGSLSFMGTMYDILESEDVLVEDAYNDVVTSPGPDSDYEWGMLVPSTETDTDSTETVTESEMEEVVLPIPEGYDPIPAEDYTLGTPYISPLTEEERNTFAILLYLEAGAEPLDLQYACGSVVINRLTTSGADSILDIIYAKNQFSPAKLIYKYQPRETQLQIVDWLCTYGPTIPEYVTYFRAGHYHNWDDVEDWKMFKGNTNDVYFSYSPKLYNKWLKEKELESTE